MKRYVGTDYDLEVQETFLHLALIGHPLFIVNPGRGAKLNDIFRTRCHDGRV